MKTTIFVLFDYAFKWFAIFEASPRLVEIKFFNPTRLTGYNTLCRWTPTTQADRVINGLKLTSAGGTNHRPQFATRCTGRREYKLNNFVFPKRYTFGAGQISQN
jgi:hypothetical protein